MTRQEEIKEGILQGINHILLHNLIRPRDESYYFTPTNSNEYREWLENEINEEVIKPLHSQGVVIKVDRESNDCNTCPVAIVCGYVAVEPLIKE